MEPTITRLRPLSLTELFDAVFRLYRTNFLTFIGISALLQVPFLLIQVIMSLALNQAVTGDLLRLLNELPTFDPDVDSFAQLPIGNLLTFFGLTLLLVLIQGAVVQAIISGALVRAVERIYLGYPITMLQAYKLGGHTIVSLVVAGLLLALIGTVVFTAIFGGTFLLVLLLAAAMPSGSGILVAVLVVMAVTTVMILALLLVLFLLIRFVFVTQAVVVERRGPLSALSRSWTIIRGSFWRVFGIVILFYILVQVITLIPSAGLGGVIGAIFNRPQDFVLQQTLSTLVGYAIQILVLPLMLIGYTLLYFDLRVRKEGYDLEMRVD